MKRGLRAGVLVCALLGALLGLATPAQAAFPGSNGNIAFSRGGDIYSVDGAGIVLTLLHDHAVDADNPTWSPDGSKIAFCRFPGLFTMNSDGSDVEQVTTASCNFTGGKPSWSADGAKIAFVGNCGSGGSDTEICVVNADGTGLMAVTDNSDSDLAPAWSPDGTKIAFASGPASYDADIYTINPDGTGQTLVTDGLGTNQGPNWSPDGSRIAFYSDRDCIGCDAHDIYTINADGTGLARLTMTPDYDTVPAYSPDGTKIVFEGCDPNDCPQSARAIRTMNADGSGQASFMLGQSPDWGVPSPPFPPVPADGRIAYASHQDFHVGNRDEIYSMYTDGFRRTRLTNNDRGDTDPDWNPRFAVIAYTSRADDGNSEIFTMLGDGRDPANLTMHPALDAQPSWSPEADKIAFSSDRGEGSTTGIYVMNSNGSSPTELTDPPEEVSDRTPAWSPDGGKIAFVSNLDGDDDIYFVNPNGSGLENVSNTDGVDEASPAWSPYGTRLAYVRIEPGQPQNVWTMNRDGSGQSQLTSDPVGASSPTWSPTATKIAFASGDGDIHAVKSDGTGLVNLTDTPHWSEYDPAWQRPGFLPPPGYARPRSATPVTVHLVPAYEACSAPNGSHGAPLSSPSCSPPVEESDHLTTSADVGTGWAGSLQLKRLCTDGAAPPCGAPGDQEDVLMTASITDVRRRVDGSDYDGELRASLPLRITDRYNTPGLLHPPATVQDLGFGFPMACTPTAGSIGSTCSASTTADAILPGTAREGKRAIWQIGQIEVYDGGADGDADTTGDNTLFAVQGLFVP